MFKRKEKEKGGHNEQLNEYKYNCYLCWRSLVTTPGLELQVDHIIPWSKGDSH